MMDLALFTANASQLRYILNSPYWDFYHHVNIVLISLSIALQVNQCHSFREYYFIGIYLSIADNCWLCPDIHWPLRLPTKGV